MQSLPASALQNWNTLFQKACPIGRKSRSGEPRTSQGSAHRISCLWWRITDSRLKRTPGVMLSNISMHQNHLECSLKYRPLGPPCRASDSVGFGWVRPGILHFFTGPQIMLMLLIWGLLCEDHWSKSLEGPPPLLTGGYRVSD